MENTQVTKKLNSAYIALLNGNKVACKNDLHEAFLVIAQQQQRKILAEQEEQGDVMSFNTADGSLDDVEDDVNDETWDENEEMIDDTPDEIESTDNDEEQHGAVEAVEDNLETLGSAYDALKGSIDNFVDISNSNYGADDLAVDFGDEMDMDDSDVVDDDIYADDDQNAHDEADILRVANEARQLMRKLKKMTEETKKMKNYKLKKVTSPTAKSAIPSSTRVKNIFDKNVDTLSAKGYKGKPLSFKRQDPKSKNLGAKGGEGINKLKKVKIK